MASVAELQERADAAHDQVQQLTEKQIRKDLNRGRIRRTVGTALNSTIILAPLGIPLSRSGRKAARGALRNEGFTADEAKRIEGHGRGRRTVAALLMMGSSGGTNPVTGALGLGGGAMLWRNGRKAQVEQARTIMRDRQEQGVQAEAQLRTARDMPGAPVTPGRTPAMAR